ncbi:MAG: 50S ribosomal protein L19 [candidate division WWE3 bacterium]|nr:50S ribosomal protein L19 [candidate division WWE3 bacterium]
MTDFRPGDTIKVFYKVTENGKARIQPFEGVCIARHGMGVSKTFMVRKIATGGIGVERIFPDFSPNISKIEVTKQGDSRRAKLYYLRNRLGKAATRVKTLKSSAPKSKVGATIDETEVSA